MKNLCRAVLLAVIPGLALAAGQPRTAPTKMVPEELLLAVITSSPVSTANAAAAPPTLVVGRTPDEFPADVLPAGMKPLGGSAAAARLVVYAIADMLPDEVRPGLETQLSAAGWRKLGMPTQAGGFVGQSVPAMWCGADRASLMNLSITPRTAGGSYIAWTVNRSQSPSNVCSMAPPGTTIGSVNGVGALSGVPPGAMPSMMRMESLRNVMPALRAPDGVSINRTSGTGDGQNSYMSSTRASGDLAAGELLQKFSEQVQAAGWSAQPAMLSASSAAQIFELHDDKGKVYTGLLVVTAVSGTRDRDVVFRIADVTP